MRNVFLFILFAIFSFTGLYGQKKKFVTVKASENIMDVLPAAEVFYYPVFTKGKVYRKDGTMAEANLNYNRLVDEIHFISAKGDTLALADERTIKYVAIEKDSFCFDKGYLRLLQTGKKGKLAVKQIWEIANTRQLGAYNSTNATVSVTSFTSMNEGGRLYDLTVNADIILAKAEKFYLANENEQFAIASKKNLMVLFPKEEKAIGAYIKENKIDFTNRADLTRIIQFLEDL